MVCLAIGVISAILDSFLEQMDVFMVSNIGLLASLIYFSNMDIPVLSKKEDIKFIYFNSPGS